jgi:23S rRNA (uracil1939-C5)-methyltransferase
MPKPRRGDAIRLSIDDLAFGGEGVGRLNGYVMFVRGGLPGDQLTVRVTEARARYGRGVIESVDVPAPERVAAPCQYFGRCGGCRLQHLSYAAQLAFKEKQVRDCLERIGGLPPFELRPILAAPDPYGYRNKMEFTVAPSTAGALVGLHEADRYDAIVDIDRCLLQSETMNALLAETRAETRAHGVRAYETNAAGDASGLLRFVTLREGRNTREAMVNFVAAAPAVEALVPVAERLRERVPATTSVLLNVNDTKSSVAVGHEEHLLLGRDTITETLGGVRFRISANSFFQTNTAQAERLFALVIDACELRGAERVIDLYCGTGAISLQLARRCRQVFGVELVPAAIEDAMRNASTNAIGNCSFLAGEVQDVLPDLVRQGVQADVVVADPPRAGFHPKALAALAAMAPPRLVYVSCNPSTLARDVGDLARQGYTVDWVQPVDMFPQTAHIEAVARLRRA